jgi:ribonuclease-3
MEIESFQERLGYRFQDQSLLRRALTHPSYANEKGELDNQRLEFLGDAVLDLIASRMLFDSYGQANEGELSRRRAAMVNEEALAAIGLRLNIGDFLRLGKSEMGSGGRSKPSVLADAVEAVAGAIYCESGYPETEKVFRHWLTLPADPDTARGDPKSRLQEWVQKRHNQLPEYIVEEESGPHHERLYSVAVSVCGSVRGRGRGRSKKEAERAAAQQALKELEHA